MESLRIATFNCENLFSRAKVLNYKDKSIGDKRLQEIAVLQALLDKPTYSPEDKASIFKKSTEELKSLIEIRENRGKLYKYSGTKPVAVKAGGRGDWDGEIVFKDAKFSEVARENTAHVFKDVKADVLCVVETESLPVLRAFDTDMLGSRYRHEMLIDAFDPRGIDVGLYSKYPFGAIRTHMFTKVGNNRVFSRDCLHVEVQLSGARTLHMLCNHLKSKGYGSQTTSDTKRRLQCEELARILGQFNLKKDWVVVAGDFNDYPSSKPLQPLLTLPDLHDVLGLQFGDSVADRWTYYYKKAEQIDYLLVSTPMKACFLKAGVERRGIYDLEAIAVKAGNAATCPAPYPTVTCWTDAASDHGAVWAEFKL